jgi:predicted dehydrogenase
MNRRQFLGSAAAVAAFTIVPRHVLAGSGTTPPSEKLNIACIGIGGQGASDIQSVSSENIVALCDVDWSEHSAGTFKAFPNAKKYKDFRKMLDAEDKNIDAVTVSTPDNIHAVAAMAAMKHGKHVYCEKPLCHDVYEVRQLTEAARKYKVVTQMGTQIHGTAEMKFFVEIVQSGLIGKIHKVDLWSGKNWGGGVRPTDTPAVPETLDWDLWLGPAPYRPYHPCYLPGLNHLAVGEDLADAWSVAEAE